MKIITPIKIEIIFLKNILRVHFHINLVYLKKFNIFFQILTQDLLINMNSTSFNITMKQISRRNYYYYYVQTNLLLETRVASKKKTKVRIEILRYLHLN